MVAANAAIPIFGFQDWEYRRLGEVLIYPGSFGKEYYQASKGEDANILGLTGLHQLRGDERDRKNMKKKKFSDDIKKRASKFFQKEWQDLSDLERRVLSSIVEKQRISRNTNKVVDDDRTFGERLADKVASFGGSWTFIMSFGCVLLFWVFLNSFILARSGGEFDPYPYILLNLFLSMLASIQAPIIMMSQNRQAIKDRLDAQHDYEVNLKAEIEIANLHEKFDELRERVMEDLLNMQKEQTQLLNQIKVQTEKP